MARAMPGNGQRQATTKAQAGVGPSLVCRPNVVLRAHPLTVLTIESSESIESWLLLLSVDLPLVLGTAIPRAVAPELQRSPCGMCEQAQCPKNGATRVSGNCVWKGRSSFVRIEKAPAAGKKPPSTRKDAPDAVLHRHVVEILKHLEQAKVLLPELGAGHPSHVGSQLRRGVREARVGRRWPRGARGGHGEPGLAARPRREVDQAAYRGGIVAEATFTAVPQCRGMVGHGGADAVVVELYLCLRR